MEVSPLGFGTMTGLLAIQGIPLVLLLEGGYFLESIGECSESVLKALIERSSPKIFLENIGPSPQLLDSLAHSLHVFCPLLNFDFVECVNLIRKAKKLAKISKFTKNEYKGKRELSYPFPTRDQYTPRDTGVEEGLRRKLHELIILRSEHPKQEAKLSFGKSKKFLELTIDSKTYKLNFDKFVDIMFTYHFVVLPLTLKYEFTTSLQNFTNFLSNFPLSSITNELISEKLIGDILTLCEDFGFW